MQQCAGATETGEQRSGEGKMLDRRWGAKKQTNAVHIIFAYYLIFEAGFGRTRI